MKNKSNFFNKLVTLLVVLSLSGQSVAFAQAPQQQDDLRIGYNDATGKVSFIGADPSKPIIIRSAQAQGLQADSRAMAMISPYAADFGLKNPSSELKLTSADQVEGREVTRFQQVYNGVPVLGGEMIVNATDQAELLSLSAEISPDLSLDTNPSISPKQAQITALEAMSKSHQVLMDALEATNPELWIYDSRLLEPDGTPVTLVWRMEVKSRDNSLPINELVLVDAKRGAIVLNFNQIDTAWSSLENNVEATQNSETTTANLSSKIPKFNGYSSTIINSTNKNIPALLDISWYVATSLISTYTAGGTSSIPGTFLCDQSQPNCTNGSNVDADKAHQFALEVHQFYASRHNRNSIDNNGMPIISTVDYMVNYQNAFWNGDQMVYGDGYSLADDVVGHELTHGVTEYESNLFYYYQSGAINESFSDVWGELYDQQNGAGTDGTGVKWLIGEDLPGGALRSMINPPLYSDPDKMTSVNYYTGTGDGGGVHYNSGINNKAVSLMVDGGAFNGRTVTAIGADKTLAIYYEVQTNLLVSGADYADLYNALYQGCLNLVGGPAGIVAGDCQQVRKATDAVEMSLQPVANFNTDAPLCTVAETFPNNIFADDLESGTSNWTFANGANVRWQYDSPYGPYAHSGTHFLYADDYPEAITDATARLTSIVIPSNAYLHFAHAYDFEKYTSSSNYYDGGVLEYSNNNGVTWADAGALIDYNGYKGTIYPSWNNPLKGRSAFVGASHGYISTRLNLASLAGQTVTFRWRMGLDDTGFMGGWFVDDVRVYNCISRTISGNAGASGVTLSYTTDGTARAVISQVNGSYSLKVPNNWSGTVTPTHPCFTFSPENTSYVNVTSNQGTQNYTPTIIPASGCAKINVDIGGVIRGIYGLPAQGSLRQNYTGVDSGPAKVISTDGTPIISAIRAAWAVNGVTTSFSQLMGLPLEQLSDTYVFPGYNNVTLNDQLRIANVDTISSTVTVTIGGTVRGTYPLAAGAAVRINYPGLDSGPVVVQGTSGVKIISSIREAWAVNGVTKSFVQLMGLPAGQLSNKYVFPAYNNVTLNEQLRIGNVDTVDTTVTVTIGGNLKGTYPLAPGQAVRINYAGLDSGPVVVEGTAGVNIISSIRDAWAVNGVTTSFSQLMGMPAEQLSDKYLFPGYNNVTLNDQLRISNVDTLASTVTVTIGGVVRGTYPLAAGGAVRINYPGLDSGPVVVQGTSGVKIISSIREAWAVNGVTQSFVQLMGLPAGQLSATYMYPGYNNVTLNEQLRFAVP